MRSDDESPGFRVRKAKKEHICYWCGILIKKGDQYFYRIEHDKALAKMLERATGYPVRIIKARTGFWYCDAVGWSFCSFNCMSNFFWYKSRNKLPEEVEERVLKRYSQIVNKVKDILSLMTSLKGRNVYNTS